MKKILLLVFITANFCFAQKQHNVWYFGYNAGVSFNSGAPVSISGGQTSAGEGVASICDTSGNILFYTDGITVWNRNNVIMPNGTGLLGNWSTTQSATILKQPSSANLFYIFTCPVEGSFNPVAYSIVDMTLNGGNGDVTVKNSPLLDSASEKLTYVRHSNGTDYWIICHKWNSSSFYSYVFSATGVNLIPVISTTGIYQGGNINNAIGYLKPSPCGDKLASALWQMDSLEIFDFNISTGVVSNGYSLAGFTASSGVYGVEFSPSGRYLYAAVITPAWVYQYDMHAGSLAAIAASQTLVGTSSNNFNGALQTGPDGKMYMTKYNSTYLAVLNYPDSAGLLSGFVDNAVSLGSNMGALGLPNYTADQFCSSAQLPIAAFQSSDSVFCSEPGECINFFDLSTGNPTTWHWLFPGASTDSSNLQNPTNICYYVAGTYSVTLSISNSVGSDTLTVFPMIIVGNPPAVPNITVLGGDTLICSHAPSYQWYLNGSPIPGATDSFYVAHQGGTYSVQVFDNGCNSLSNGVVITNITPILEELNIKLYPNPAKDEVAISWQSGLSEIVDLTVINVLGELVYDKTIVGKREGIINCKSFSAGVYFVRVNDGQKEWNRKLIIK